MTPARPLQRALYIKGRSCRNCTGPIPKPVSNKAGNLRKKIFCCDNCRKEFHKNNGISVHRLKDQVQTWIRQQIPEIAKLVAEEMKRTR